MKKKPTDDDAMPLEVVEGRLEEQLGEDALLIGKAERPIGHLGELVVEDLDGIVGEELAFAHHAVLDRHGCRRRGVLLDLSVALLTFGVQMGSNYSYRKCTVS